MLCYAILCCPMLCYPMLCYPMLCYAVLSYAMLCYAAHNRAVPTVQCHLYILRRSQYLWPHLSLRTSTSLSHYFPTYSFFSYSLSASSSPFPSLPLTQTLMHHCPSPPHTPHTHSPSSDSRWSDSRGSQREHAWSHDRSEVLHGEAFRWRTEKLERFVTADLKH